MPEPIVILDSTTILKYIDQLTNDEALELNIYAQKGKPEQFSERATAWLIAKGKVKV